MQEDAQKLLYADELVYRAAWGGKARRVAYPSIAAPAAPAALSQE